MGLVIWILTLLYWTPTRACTPGEMTKPRSLTIGTLFGSCRNTWPKKIRNMCFYLLPKSKTSVSNTVKEVAFLTKVILYWWPLGVYPSESQTSMNTNLNTNLKSVSIKSTSSPYGIAVGIRIEIEIGIEIPPRFYMIC